MYISHSLNGADSTTHHKIKYYSGIKFTSQYQQTNLCHLQKNGIGSIRFAVVTGNQYLSVIWVILNILNILVSTLYLMLSPLMLENISDYEGNEYVAEVGYKSNNDSYYTLHVEIP